MIGEVLVTGLILARGGSKRLPGKNIRLLGGKPMITWTIEAAFASATIDRTILSTDDEDIMVAARAAGCEVPFHRPAHLASDEASSVDVVLHAIDELELTDGYIVLLQPTSPLRIPGDIDGCVKACHENRAPACATVSKLEHSASWHISLDERGRVYRPFANHTETLYRPNGAVYVADIAWFRTNHQFWVEGVTLAYETPVNRAVDVDTEADFIIAQALIGAMNGD